jgi:alkanesulfonate monooxygenase SsuD/methylene tetrahydromethanopterin reductase-like flavin-dependent oxidoreductase (luciferase family)
MVAALDEQAAIVRLARDRGWDSFLASMHYLVGGDVQQLQQVPLLARLQAEAGDMTMGVAVFLLPLHNPVYAAETLATLDVIARGRFVIGLGMGYRKVEFDAFGVSERSRVRRFTGNLDIIKRLWTGESVSHEGDGWRLEDARMNLLPVQRPHPPLWIAANHDNAVRRAAHLGDCWYINPHATLETIRRQLDIYRDELRALGKPLPAVLPCRKELICAKDRRAALALAAPSLGEKYRLYAAWGQDRALPQGERFDMPFEDLARERFIVGSPEDCHEQLRPWIALGVNHFVFRTHFVGMTGAAALDSMKLFSDEVLPELRKSRAA